jgi:hypothetical protein
VANEGGGSFRRRDGRTDAETFDLITAQPNAYTGQADEMRDVNSSARVLGYVNGALVPPGRAHAYPDDWYAQDATGDLISSLTFGNLLMDPRRPGWVHDRADACRRAVEESGYDGCMLDVLGVAPLQPGYTTAPPVDPETGDAFSEREWLSATSALASGVKDELGNDVLVIANGLDGSERYFAGDASSSVLLDGVDGGVAESWLRRAEAPLDARLDEQDWVREVEMVEDAGFRGKMILVLPKAWTRGSEAAKSRVHEFALATFLLGAHDLSFFAFSYGPQQDPTRVRRLDRLHLGAPTEPRRVEGDTYLRRFQRGIALVNPTGAPRTVEVGGGLVGVDGPVGATVRLPPYSGRVLQRATSDR